MTDETIRERLAALRPLDVTGAQKLADDLAKEARTLPWAFALALGWPEFSDRSKAVSVLRQIPELAILPWLSASRKLHGASRIQSLDEARYAFEETRRQVMQKLRAMLQSRTPLPPPPDLGAEVRAPVTRECDEAYLLLRHLHLPDEDEPDERRSRRWFSRESEAERDRAIQRYLQTGEFQ